MKTSPLITKKENQDKVDTNASLPLWAHVYLFIWGRYTDTLVQNEIILETVWRQNCMQVPRSQTGHTYQEQTQASSLSINTLPDTDMCEEMWGRWMVQATTTQLVDATQYITCPVPIVLNMN